METHRIPELLAKLRKWKIEEEDGEEVIYPFHIAAAFGDVEEGKKLVARAEAEKKLEELLGADDLGKTAENYARLPKAIADHKLRSKEGEKFSRFRQLIEEVKAEVQKNAMARIAAVSLETDLTRDDSETSTAPYYGTPKVMAELEGRTAGGAGGDSTFIPGPPSREKMWTLVTGDSDITAFSDFKNVVEASLPKSDSETSTAPYYGTPKVIAESEDATIEALAEDFDNQTPDLMFWNYLTQHNHDRALEILQLFGLEHVNITSAVDNSFKIDDEELQITLKSCLSEYQKYIRSSLETDRDYWGKEASLLGQTNRYIREKEKAEVTRLLGSDAGSIKIARYIKKPEDILDLLSYTVMGKISSLESLAQLNSFYVSLENISAGTVDVGEDTRMRVIKMIHQYIESPLEESIDVKNYLKDILIKARVYNPSPAPTHAAASSAAVGRV